MLNIVLADSEIELIPPKIYDHPIIKRSSNKRNKDPSEMILDSNFHHKAMKDLDDNERRGRPDIIHISLLCGLESILNKKGKLNIYIHTRKDKIIEIDPDTRLPRSYNRFLGLFEKLFKTKKVPKELELLKLKENNLNNFLKTLKGKKLVMTSEGKNENNLKKHFTKAGDYTIIIGGFPKGGYLSNPEGKKLSIYKDELTAWTVLNEVVTEYGRREIE